MTQACIALDSLQVPCSGELEYKPRKPEETVIFQVVQSHLETFLEEAQNRDPNACGVPDFIEQEFRRFLTCGHLAGGFIRLKCEKCNREELLPFSCKVRALCPSCAGRRMAERAAHLADNVLGSVPVKQWVLSLPFWLRYKLAWDHKLTKAVLAEYAQALEAFYADRAEQRGLKNAKTGSVTVIQRAGGGLNINIHFHTSVIDGIFMQSETGELTFHRAVPLEDEEIVQLTFTIRKNILQLLENRGISTPDGDDSDYDPLTDDNPTLANLYSASMAYCIYLGPRAGQRVIRIGHNPYGEYAISRGKGHAHIDGFDLHAGETIRVGDKERLERLLRYVLRPPVAQHRLKLQNDGRILLELKNSWNDGTTHLLFEPIEFLEKLSAIIPKPQINLIIYSGVLAPNAKWQKKVVNLGKEMPPGEKKGNEKESLKPTARSLTWAELMMRVFAIDVLACRHCNGRLRVISIIKENAVIKKILDHLGLESELPRTSPSRASPRQEAFEY